MRFTPKRRKILSSVGERIILVCTSQLRNSPNLLMAFRAFSSLTAQMERATKTSSVCKRGLRCPRAPVLSSQTGSITEGEIRFISSGMPAKHLSALSKRAELAPNNLEVLPVIIFFSLFSPTYFIKLIKACD